MRPLPISPNTFLYKKSQVKRWSFVVYQQRKFANKDNFVFLFLSSATDAVQNLMKLIKCL